jgi:hypothetical protein
MAAYDAQNIRHGMLIDLNVNGTVYYLSNLYKTLTWNGHEYQTMGSFLNITEMQNDLRATNNQLSVGLSGIPVSDDTPDFLNVVLNSKVKGSRIQIYRAFFNPNTLTIIDVYQRYNGYVSNYSLSENWDQEDRLTSNSISLSCSNINAIIERQYAGRRTNPGDQEKWFPNDTGMYRVKLLADTQFDFGKKYSGATTSGGSTTPDTSGGYTGGGY